MAGIQTDTPVRALKPCVSWRQPRARRSLAILICLGVFAFGWSIVRAHVQAVTGDEAESYIIYVARAEPSHWEPSSNNHLLNSMLMRLSTAVFGLSHLSVRMPALSGAAIYIGSAVWICSFISTRRRLQIPLFLCLTYNPFLFDFYVAARGYGMANGFLLGGIATISWCHLGIMHGLCRKIYRCWAAASICFALSFASSFSFAFIDAFVFLALLIWSIQVLLLKTEGSPVRIKALVKLALAAIIPGLLVTVLVPLHTLLRFPKSQIFDGAESLTQTLATVAEAVVFQPNPYFVTPLLGPSVQMLRTWLLPVLLGLTVVHAGVYLLRRSRSGDPQARWLLALAFALIGALACAVTAHWAAFEFGGLLLPHHRTAIWIAPLTTLAIGALASLPAEGRQRLSSGALTSALGLTAVYFLLCMRLTYFKEWQYQADIKQAYDFVACYNHALGIEEVETGWYYHAGMNFYRLLSGRETLLPFSSSQSHPTDKKMYVLNGVFEHAFVEAEKLQIVYRGSNSEVLVALRPDIKVSDTLCRTGFQ